MIISVDMVNWRAYQSRKIPFSPGITFLLGANGAGKTSILEAIAYALTGETATVQDRPRLLHDPEQLATVRLSFTVHGQEYQVERSQSYTRAEGAELTQVSNGKVLAKSHRSVTGEIEGLMGVSADFLRRIVYMAEGDVFRFLDQPPGKAINLQIGRVLGLTQLDEFSRALDLAAKELKPRIRELQDLVGDLDRLGVRHAQDLARQLSGTEQRREDLVNDLRSEEAALTEFERESVDILRLSSLLSRNLPRLQADPELWAAGQQIPLLELLRRLKQHAEQFQKTMQTSLVAQARLDGQIASARQILDLVTPLAGQADEQSCPVCNQPISREERGRIVLNIQAQLAHANAELQKRMDEHTQASNREATLREQITGLREVSNALTHLHTQTLRPDVTLLGLQQTLQSAQATYQEHLEQRRSHLARLQQNIADATREKAEYLAIEQRLRSQGYSSPDEVGDALVRLEIRSLSIRAAQQAVQETLTRQRNVDMQAINDQVARIWEAFVQEGEWRMHFDGQGRPILEDNQGRQFDLSQFSGGEKTALLMILHILIAQHFSQSDFLLIDEPLEHLDPVNRRSLIRFLVTAYRRNSFRQAIVATFEESLIRKYMREAGVHIVHV